MIAGDPTSAIMAAGQIPQMPNPLQMMGSVQGIINAQAENKLQQQSLINAQQELANMKQTGANLQLTNQQGQSDLGMKMMQRHSQILYGLSNMSDPQLQGGGALMTSLNQEHQAGVIDDQRYQVAKQQIDAVTAAGGNQDGSLYRPLLNRGLAMTMGGPEAVKFLQGDQQNTVLPGGMTQPVVVPGIGAAPGTQTRNLGGPIGGGMDPSAGATLVYADKPDGSRVQVPQAAIGEMVRVGALKGISADQTTPVQTPVTTTPAGAVSAVPGGGLPMQGGPAQPAGAPSVVPGGGLPMATAPTAPGVIAQALQAGRLTPIAPPPVVSAPAPAAAPASALQAAIAARTQGGDNPAGVVPPPQPGAAQPAPQPVAAVAQPAPTPPVTQSGGLLGMTNGLQFGQSLPTDAQKTLAGASRADDYAAMSALSTKNYNDTQQSLQSILKISPNVDTGEGTARTNMVKQVLSNTMPGVASTLGIDANKSLDQQDLFKFLSRAATMAGSSSDAQMFEAISANPHAAMSPGAMQRATSYILGLNSQDSVLTQETHAKATHMPMDSSTLTANVRKQLQLNTDANAFREPYLSPDEQARYIKSLPNDAARAKYKYTTGLIDKYTETPAGMSPVSGQQ